MSERYFKYWGKARKEEEEGVPYHLLPYHCLDVAAVGEVLLRKHGALAGHLQQLSSLDEQTLHAWLVFFLAIHDLGKFSESFQNLRPDLLQLLQDKQSDTTYAMRHDSLGWRLWQQTICPTLVPQTSSRRRRRVPLNGLDDWAAAVMGHHGLPPQEVASHINYFSADDRAAAQSFVAEVRALLLPQECAAVLPGIVESRQFSWWLAGVAVLCDWLGSNSMLFEFEDRAMALADYWEIAQRRAEEALARAELLPATPARQREPQALFPYLETPTPLQAHCLELSMGSQPQLFILEDVTGAGKTEAAVILLHRLLAQGQADGVYFALPTMATANAMYERMGDVYRRLYQEGCRPSLVLAHGARQLSEAFRHSIIPTSMSEVQRYGDETDTASAHCSAWLADNSKKALLAEVGVGTIDQALLAMLPSKHQSLRLLGLLGKVLIVDEVHACDAYVHTLLCALLKAHAAAGGSAILLSATLPASQRQKLLDAFAAGSGQTPPKIEAAALDAYPLLTHLAADKLTEKVVPTRDSVKRHVVVIHFHDEASVVEEIVKHLDRGECVCWIRNTVDDAREAAALVHEIHPKAKIDLFHARFAMADRLAIEEKIIQQFGRDSTPPDRHGRLLVATQVVEQSLDLDFDFMVSDLAPVDLLIQRAGRLRRHSRDAEGRRIEGEDQRGPATLAIYGPDPQGEIGPDWYKAHFPRAAGVYPNHAQLWLSASLLMQKGGFSMPDDARELIEGVYGEAPYPDVLQYQAASAEGEEASMRSVAMLNVLKLDQGYNRGGENCWWDEAVTPTRLGEESITVYLGRWDGDGITPWADDRGFAWPSSSLQMRRALVYAEANDDVPAQILDQAKAQLPGQGRWGFLLVLRQSEGGRWVGKVKDQQGRQRVVEYCSEDGLKVEK